MSASMVWNLHTMKAMLLALVGVVLVGCGHDTQVHVGRTGEKGTYKRDIDQAKDTADEASNRIRQGEKEVYGG